MRKANRFWLAAVWLVAQWGIGGAGMAWAETAHVSVHWDNVQRVSKTTPTLQVVVNPPLRRGSAIHDAAFKALKDLHCDYVRYVPWLPYPRLAVAELKPPTKEKTYWDFHLIDPMTLDFFNATEGHSVILNFSTIPQWMFKTDKPVTYPKDPDKAVWNYEQGTELRDPSMKEVADYYARLVSWYTQGGFTDELGKRHHSGYHYKINYWEVLNEVDFEHHMSPRFYTKLYDAIVEAIHKVDPSIKFVGMALALPLKNPKFFDYFLDPKHHRPGVPLDMISYHFYASPKSRQDLDASQYSFFDQADHFLDGVRFIEVIRKRLSPGTRTTVDELGAILPNDNSLPAGPIPKKYWNLCGAMYAYLYVQLAHLGIDVAGESQLVGYPSQFPSVSMLDWNTGEPNARYWVLDLLHRHLGPGDKMVGTGSGTSDVLAQGFVTPEGNRELLLINKRNRQITAQVPHATGTRLEVVDPTTGNNPPKVVAQLTGDAIDLNPFSVAVVSFER